MIKVRYKTVLKSDHDGHSVLDLNVRLLYDLINHLEN